MHGCVCVCACVCVHARNKNSLRTCCGTVVLGLDRPCSINYVSLFGFVTKRVLCCVGIPKPLPIPPLPLPFFPQAERQRLFISREGVLASELESEVLALEVGGQFLFDMADHRDFLGAIVNLGITRDGVSYLCNLFFSCAFYFFYFFEK